MARRWSKSLQAWTSIAGYPPQAEGTALRGASQRSEATALHEQ